jgi:hypothetical protein
MGRTTFDVGDRSTTFDAGDRTVVAAGADAGVDSGIPVGCTGAEAIAIDRPSAPGLPSVDDRHLVHSEGGD